MCQPRATSKCPYCEWKPSQLARWLWHGYPLPDQLKKQMCDLCVSERGTGRRDGGNKKSKAGGKVRSAQLAAEHESLIRRNVEKAREAANAR